MKKYIIGFIVSMIAYTVNGQRIVEKQITVKSTSSVDLKLDFADTIQVKQSKDNILRIKAIVSINDNQHNDKYEIIIRDDGDFLRVKANVNDMKSIRVPCKSHKGSNYESHGGECVNIDIYYVIEVPTVANLHIETINGNITIDNALCPMSIESISGFIDLRIPANANLDLNLKTITGGVYTNHEFNISTDNFKGNPGGTNAWFKLGSGGNKVKLSTISSDIFIRKI
ncbi:MAG: hypothetical protein HXX16_20450 [Bacteroidales bacterium]|nr:hypothetical protein [Bacteroidales bacterium]